MTYSPIGPALTAARERAGLTPEELALKAEFPMGRLLQLESGWITPMAGELECLAPHLGLGAEDLRALVDQSADRR